jgi:competence protein ComEA
MQARRCPGPRRDNPAGMGDNGSMSDPSRHPHWLLRRADQAAVAALVAAALAAMAGWWIVHGGWRGRLIEIDRADPLVAHFEVDINAADWPELMQLPGIGPTLAHRIVDSRQTAGPFADQNDLRRVRGIGPKTLEQIRPYLRPMPDARGVAATPAPHERGG